MKNPKIIFAAILGVVVCFAGYNLWSYFKEQQVIQAEEDRLAAERRVQREQERAAKALAEENERRQREQEAEARFLEEKRLAEEARLAREAEAEAQRLEAERLRAEKNAAQRAARVARARTHERIEDVPQEVIERVNGLSSRYIADHPEEFLTQTMDGDTFGPRTNFERLVQENTNILMLFAAVTPDTDLLQALLDIGMDVNSQNKAGYTPLMFAAAYSTPDAVQFLIDQGADLTAKAYIQDMNTLHIAALYNPNPDVIDVLVAAGLPLEQKVEADYTALLIAASSNQNFEVAERLAHLGADTSVYDPDGKTVAGVLEERVRGEGDRFIQISKEETARIVAIFKEN